MKNGGERRAHYKSELRRKCIHVSWYSSWTVSD